MNKNDINKEVFKNFTKVTLYCCNKCKRKVFTYHLKLMIGYYFTKLNNKGPELIHLNEKDGEIEIEHFNEYLLLMQDLDYIDVEKTQYGYAITAKKKLEDNAYDSADVDVLQEAIDKSIDELQVYLYESE